MELRPFQKRFVKNALAPGIDVAALSIPRANGKTWLAAYLLERGLTPGDSLHVPGAEYILCATTLETARMCFRFVRAALEPRGGYTFVDASNRIGIRHTASKAVLRVMSSNAKSAFGIVGCPLAVDPGSAPLLEASLAVASVKNDDAGNVRLQRAEVCTVANRADLRGAQWRRLRRHILARDGWVCQSCGKLLGMAQVDHVVPVLKGGAVSDPANLQCICVDCHIAKTRIDKGQLPDPEREAWAKHLAR